MKPYRSVLLVVGLTAGVLVLTANDDIYDTNFYLLSEAASLLAGDHPYRDFYEWGAPLAAYVSAGAQLLAGYRLVGEYLVRWLLIAAGVVISFHVGVRLCRSVAIGMVMLGLALVILAETPTYHYSKLFFFPLGVWLGWRYMDEPRMSRGALCGLTTAVAFLFRHDYGAYLGIAWVLAFVLARVVVPASRQMRSILQDAAAYVGMLALVLMPWAVVVQLNEGLAEYTRMRAVMYEEPADGAVYAAVLRLNPFRQFRPPPAPPPMPAVVAFVWQPHVDEGRRQQLERQFGLRPLDERDPNGRLRYEVSNLYDAALFGLDPYITDGSGFDWDRLEEIQQRLPTRDNTALWLEQTALLVPIFLLVTAAGEFWRSRRQADDRARRDACRMVLAGSFLVVVDSALFRQPSYMTTVAPLTAALGGRLLVARTVAGRLCAAVLLLLSTFAAVVWSRDSVLFRPSEYGSSIALAHRKLLASPPVASAESRVLQYLHDCTAPGDRLLVAGSTPYQVNYYAQRAFAGHLFWRYGWRSDPVHERQLLELLQRQSIPLAFSTHERVVDELVLYPSIRDYFAINYLELPGSRGRLLADRRRQPVRTFEPEGYPCFR